MCAAPGSKTTQLLEDLVYTHGARSGNSKGVVVANDASYHRACLLSHRVSIPTKP
jgi:16S rRNA C967 or C1407 C5-methylase (RsmB/RsmF family)